MEDPWSTPWAVDTPSVSPGLPPSRPKPVATTLPSLRGGGLLTPAKEDGGNGGLGDFDDSPWGGATTNGLDAPRNSGNNDDDGWGGWDDGKHNAWTGPSDSPTAFREPVDGFSVPWGLEDQGQDTGREGITDLAVSFGEEARHKLDVPVNDDTKKSAVALLMDEQDTWTAPSEDEELPLQFIAHVAEVPVEAKEPDVVEQLMNVNRQPGLDKEPEEDSQSYSQSLQQRPSKVQELVDMYDGIAKKAVRPPLDAIPRDSNPTTSAETSHEDLTMQHSVGDETFDIKTEPHSLEKEERVIISTQEAALSTNDPGTAAEDPISKSNTADGNTQSTAAEATPDTNSNEERRPRSTENNQSSSDSLTSKTKPPPPYPIDLSHLDALFPGCPPSTALPEPVPDVIIDGSCTTTSERKTWYRISRFGSARKHDSGGADDDSYRRITWATSEVRTKTLHIVRRWMEEDSIAGRVILGGGGGRKGGPLGASMFNWDSNEPEVEIDELLRQRAQRSGGGRHARNRSVQTADVAPQTPTTVEASDGGWGGADASISGTPSAVVQSPAFSSSTRTEGRKEVLLRPTMDSPAEIPRSPWDDGEQDNQGKQRASAELIPPPPVPTSADAAMAESSSASTWPEREPIQADEDDDWGEMVSSPTVDSSAQFASLSADADIQSTPSRQSFEGKFSGLDFCESSTLKSTRANPPPPIRTVLISSQGRSAAPSPIWTPSMNSPALEPTRASLDSTRIKSTVGTPTLASTPGLEPPCASTSSNRVSMEHAWTPAASTPTTDHRPSMDNACAEKIGTPATNTSSSMEDDWTRKGDVTIGASAASGMSVKVLTSKKVSCEDPITVDERSIVDEALRMLPDFSYMLR